MADDGRETIPIGEFDRLAREKRPVEGPFVSTFGDEQCEPYNPAREVWGTLTDGRRVKSTKHYGTQP